MFVFPSQKHKLPALHIFVILLHQILLILVTILIIHLFPAGLPACFPHGHNQGAKVVSKLVSNMHSMKRIKEVSLTHDRLGLDHNMAQKGRISGKHCNCCRGKFQMRSLKLLQRNCHVFYNLRQRATHIVVWLFRRRFHINRRNFWEMKQKVMKNEKKNYIIFLVFKK